MKSSDQTKQVDAAIFAAQQAMEDVVKKRVHPTGYKYASLADYMPTVVKAMKDNGLFAISETCDVVPSVRQQRSGANWYACYLQLNMRVIHAASGEWREITVAGEGWHNADKGIYVNTTGTRKYAFALFFNLLTVDDPESQPEPDPETGEVPQGGGQGQQPAGNSSGLDF